MRIALRADASPRIGFGHVKRCVSLAEALQRVGADVRLVWRDLGVDVAGLASGSNVPTEKLARPANASIADSVPHARWAEVGWEKDAVETSASLAAWRPDWVIVDHYAFDARWHRLVAQRLASRIGAIDDLADRELSVDVVIDHNFHSDHRVKYERCEIGSATLLGGPRFAMLSAAYANPVPFTVRSEAKSIGVFMGGVDARNLSREVLSACRGPAGFSGRIEVVATSSFAHRDELCAAASRWPDTEVLTDLPDLAAFFSRHDLQIGAGGGATWERCCVGAPTLMLVTAENQRAVLPAIYASGAAAVLDCVSEFAPQDFAEQVSALLRSKEKRSDMSRSAQKLVDGRGAIRVALWLAASDLRVRRATLADSNNMYRWRNHPATRSVSRASQEIELADHQRWLEHALTDSNRLLFVGFVGNVDVGIIRFDNCEDDRMEVSLYLDPSLHGLGLGRALLSAGEKGAVAIDRSISGFDATVLAGNAASESLFRSQGYRFERGLWRKAAGLPAPN